MVSVERVKNILLAPKETWTAIDAEAASAGGLYRTYVIPLAAIGPIATLIGWIAVGIQVGVALRQAIVEYILALISVFVLALIIEGLARTFFARKDRAQALKLAVYSSTAFWVAGIFGLIPALSWLGFLGLYSLYLLYVGLPILTKVPAEKAVPYTVSVVVAAVVLFLVVTVLTTQFA